MVEHSQELFAAGRSAVVWIIAALFPALHRTRTASQHLPELPGRAPAVTRRASVAILLGRGADLIFAVSVRRVPRKSRDEGYLSELLLVGSAAAAGLLVVAIAMQAPVP